MFFHLSIQQGELAEAFLGRLARINGANSEAAIYSIMKNTFYQPEDKGRKIPHFDYLSRSLNVPLKNFVSQHTTIPFRRAIASYEGKFAHGTYKNDSMLAYSGFRQTRKGSYFCRKCVSQDIRNFGFSYWRRDHQLPGVMSCHEHEYALNYTDKKEAFFFCPTEYLKTSKTIDPNWAASVHENIYVSRFLAISRTLIEQEFPFEVKKVRLVLREQAEMKAFSTKNGECERPLISDEILSLFPEDWLATVFPDLLEKRPREKMHKSDGVVYLSTAASSVESYILASCVLFDSEDDAIQALMSTRKLEWVPLRPATFNVDTNELKDAYVQAKGRYANLEVKTSESKWNIHNRLTDLGLPNLKQSMQFDYFSAISAFYCEGQSLQKSADLGGIEVAQLEQIVRQVGFEFAKTLQLMSPPRKQKKGVPRIKAKAPNEVITDSDSRR
jgi:hypothetical protein